MTKIFVIAGEASGDRLGGLLLHALRAEAPGATFAGVGGDRMIAEGFCSLFPISDLAVMGLAPVLARLPRLLRRLNETVAAILNDPPDCLVLIDAPDFTHRVARRIRAAAPHIPIIDYVSPTVWAWRPGRAKAMRAYVDLVLAILPFEPAAYVRLAGPRCVYVGHPLIEALPRLARRGERENLLLVLPGSREAEIKRLAPIYGEAAGLLARARPRLEVAVPVAPQMRALVETETARWPVSARLLGEEEKYSAFGAARVALVTSGAATLELALAQAPMVVAYKVACAESLLRFLVNVEHFALPNLILERRAVPEFFQSEATPAALARALEALLDEGPARLDQIESLALVQENILAGGRSPSARAASLILKEIDASKRRGPRR
ncbi:MAG TPA: lipid-A-disaccharide synthase [Methylocystis sp.]|nr:lipid-A-disaccharide synthase [Methylocystis sp.]